MNEREALVQQQKSARRTSKRGLLLLASLPAPIALCLAANLLPGMLALVAVVVSVIYGLGAGITGITMLVGGSAEHFNLENRIAAIDEARQLPAAHTVKQ